MAKIRQNIIIEGLSGVLGDQLVIRQDKAGRTIISAKHAFDPDHEFTPAQKQHHLAFREAAAYAMAAKDLPVYALKAEGTPLNIYNVALADWFHPPQVLEIDLDGWDGQPGQVIRVRAIDDVQVRQVTVSISTGNGTLIERGAALPAEGAWWLYTTSAPVGGQAQVQACAQDLPGHVGEMTIVK